MQVTATAQEAVTGADVLAPGPIDVQRASELLGGGAQGYMRLWDLFAHGFVHIAMDVPIEVDTRITFEQPTGGAAWLNAL